MYPSSPRDRRPADSFPRTRGDVPLSAPAPVLAEGLPPHARGCTVHATTDAAGVGASPARAGMYLGGGVFPDRVSGFPRTRGDVPTRRCASRMCGALPPHARGCTVEHLHGDGETPASPARAGMYLFVFACRGGGAGFPRTRGDVPAAEIMRKTMIELPPHARGCTPVARDDDWETVASPARAGMYPGAAPAGAGAHGFPRTRGDVPIRSPARDCNPELPPHARGCTLGRGGADAGGGASPARAGMYRTRPADPAAVRRFPRTRGDVPMEGIDKCTRSRLPPHARGCTRRRIFDSARPSASPARAGMYPKGPFDGVKTFGFPRTRGDVPCAEPVPRDDAMLPPHARGCTQSTPCCWSRPAASPARAGMYPGLKLPQHPRRRFPRTRGDVPRFHRGDVRTLWLPPHARGCTLETVMPGVRMAASPARAGTYSV